MKRSIALLLLGVFMADSSAAQYENQLKEKGPNTMSFMETLLTVKKVFFEGNTRTPRSKLPEVKPDLSKFVEPSEELKFVWFGHSTFLMNLDTKHILVDPVFSGSASPFSFLVKRFQKPVLALEELPHIDTIVISHDHYDHLDEESIKFFVNKTATFIVPIGVGKHLRKWGINKERITELNWGESKTEDEIVYTATPAQHFSGRGIFDRNSTLWASWVIQGKHEKIYYSGDSGYGPHFKDIGNQHGPFDYAFIENGQYNVKWPDVHMQPEESLQAMVDLNAKRIIPVHWGMFDLSLHHWSEPIVRTYKIATAWHMPILTPRLGEVVSPATHKNSPWWEGIIQRDEKSVREKTASQETAPALHSVKELATK